MMKAIHGIGSVRNQSPKIQPRYLDICRCCCPKLIAGVKGHGNDIDALWLRPIYRRLH